MNIECRLGNFQAAFLCQKNTANTRCRKNSIVPDHGIIETESSLPSHSQVRYTH